jgi:hypothetical protein
VRPRLGRRYLLSDLLTLGVQAAKCGFQDDQQNTQRHQDDKEDTWVSARVSSAKPTKIRGGTHSPQRQGFARLSRMALTDRPRLAATMLYATSFTFRLLRRRAWVDSLGLRIRPAADIEPTLQSNRYRRGYVSRNRSPWFSVSYLLVVSLIILLIILLLVPIPRLA